MRIPVRLISLAYFIAFIFNSNLSFTQISFGPKVGLNFSEVPNNTKYIIGNQHVYGGYHLGVIAEFRLFEHLFIQPGVLITNKGSKYIVGNDSVRSSTGFSDFQFSSFNADIPLNLIYKFDLGSFKLFLIAGPSLGYGLTGKWIASDSTSSKVHYGKAPDDDLKPFDYGFNFGGGLEVGRIQLSSQYYFGLRTLSTLTQPLQEQKYKVLTISIAYLFGNNETGYKDLKSKYLGIYGKRKMNRERFLKRNLK